jgi:hypothetical protein
MSDAINGLFELIGGVLICLSIRQLNIDKQVKGVSILPTTFFASWGLWNIWFYPSLGCWFSFAGGLVVVTANIIWVGQMIYYSRRSAVDGTDINPA